jgi:hypothetical protein
VPGQVRVKLLAVAADSANMWKFLSTDADRARDTAAVAIREGTSASVVFPAQAP